MMISGLVVVSLPFLGACNGLLEPDNKDAVTDAQLDAGGAAVIPAMLTGVAHDFAVSYDYVVTNSGLLSDELQSTGVWGLYTTMDQGGTQAITVQNANLGNIVEPHWNYLQATRVLAEKAYNTVKTAGPVDANPYAAQARVYSGLAYLFLGELTCDVAFDLGPAQNPVEALKIADTHLTEAISIATAANLTSGTTNYAALARLIRARVKMDLGQLPAAAADAALVPNTFSWVVNPVVKGGTGWTYFHTVGTFPTATTGPRFANTGDPRILTKAGTYVTATIPLVIPLKYSLSDSPLILGNWQEARLIQAEVELTNGNVAAAVTFMNQVRAATAGLAPLSTSATAAQALQFLQTERGNQLFLQARRLVDAQRWNLVPPEFTSTTTPFARICIPVPQSERDANLNLGTVHSTRLVTTFIAQ